MKEASLQRRRQKTIIKNGQRRVLIRFSFKNGCIDSFYLLIIIDYCNNKRIKIKRKGLSPLQYKTKSFT
uniref:IS3 family transposase n=1 Tax=Streptococcus pyogenes TaxID=1314 RepID=UPI0039047EEA